MDEPLMLDDTYANMLDLKGKCMAGKRAGMGI